jgi:hypothetical protein
MNSGNPMQKPNDQITPGKATDQIEIGKTYPAGNQGTGITPRTIDVTVVWIDNEDHVHYRKENEMRVHQTPRQRFLEIITGPGKIKKPKPIKPLTAKQLDMLYDIGDEFWLAFSKLCNDHIAKAVQEGIPEDYTTLFLGEKTSIYGRKTSPETDETDKGTSK